MTKPNPPISQETPADGNHHVRVTLNDIGRRQWWLWSAAITITILLTLGIVSFAFPGLLAEGDAFYAFSLNQALRGLAGMVLLFDAYAIYQQYQIQCMQRMILEQTCAVEKIKTRTEEVYELAMIDPLTGLYNRRFGEQRLSAEVARSQRNGLPLTIMILDVNALKYVNDTHGHAAGDELITYFAGRLTKAIRGSDLAVRVGGDEFLLILPECKIEEVHCVLGRLVELRIDLAGEPFPFTFAAGWTSYIPGETTEDLMGRADGALYANKRASKEQIEWTNAAQ
jgi:diguanylate cyclase (GGDEF)-like protein